MGERRKDTRRTNDATVLLLAQNLSNLKEEVKGLKKEFIHKFDNGITAKIENIVALLNNLPCDLHKLTMKIYREKIDDINDKKMPSMDKKINGFYWAIVMLIVSIIGTGVWLKN